MTQRTTWLTLGLGGIASLAVNPPVAAQMSPPIALGQQCQRAIASMEAQMMTNGVTVGYLSVQDISEQYTDEPRPLALSLWLDADDTMAQGDIVQSSSALDLYESLDRLQRYTGTITDDCEAIAAVKFQLTEYQSRMLG